MNINVQSKKMPEHQLAYESVRKLILFGNFAPGHPVTIQGLAEQLDAGVTPIREAIRRLTAEHALEALGNRRVCVPIMTVEKLEELYFVREFIEPQLAARAAKNIMKTNIQRLEKSNFEVDCAIELGDIARYLENNYYFHFELYALAKSETLYKIADSIWLQLAPFLRVICGRCGTLNLVDQHVELLRHLLNGDANAAHDALKEDLRQGKEIILNNMIKSQHT